MHVHCRLEQSNPQEGRPTNERRRCRTWRTERRDRPNLTTQFRVVSLFDERNYAWRAADGSYNNIDLPDMGKISLPFREEGENGQFAASDTAEPGKLDAKPGQPVPAMYPQRSVAFTNYDTFVALETRNWHGLRHLRWSARRHG